MVSKIERYIASLSGKKIAFIGAGVAHRDLIPIFVRHGADVRLCDKRADIEMDGVELFLAENYLDGLSDADVIFRTPGFMSSEPAIKQAIARGATITSEIETFFELCNAKIYAITGSDGKTTTTSLIADMLSRSGKTVHLGGNIGRAMLPIIDEVDDSDIVVCELSSFQLMSMKHAVDVAVVTNITPNHLDHHADMQEYIEAKRNILTFRAGGFAVLGYDNELSRSFENSAENVRFFSLSVEQSCGGYLKDEVLTLRMDGEEHSILPAKEIKIPGRHNIENMLAACTAVAGEVSVQCMASTAREFAGVAHRIEFVREKEGVAYYNDSIATSPTRVIAGLRAFDRRLIVIAGGYDKKISYAPLAPELIAHAKALVLMGDTGPIIERELLCLSDYDSKKLPLYHANGMENAVALATAAAEKGDVITLSPASASFDCYANFEKRGEHFKEIVNKL